MTSPILSRNFASNPALFNFSMRPPCNPLFLLWALGAALLLPNCDDSQHLASEHSISVATHPEPGNSNPTADSTAPVFDIPALVTLTADQIKGKLGQPLSDAQESDNDQMKTLSYQRLGYELLIRYEVRSRRILDFYFSPAKSWQRYNYLLKTGNLIQDDNRYKVRPLNETDGLYEGIVVTPPTERVMNRFGKWVPVEQAQ